MNVGVTDHFLKRFLSGFHILTHCIVECIVETGALSSIMWAEHQTTIDAMHFRVKFPGLGFEDGNDVTTQKVLSMSDG